MISESLIKLITSGNDKFPLTKAFLTGHRYYTDFIKMMNFFSEKLPDADYKSIEMKVIAGSSLDEQTYLQTMCELTVVYYAMRYYGEKEFAYEPKYNGGYNPEGAFRYKEKTVNFEVKCPNMSKRMEIENHNTLKLFSAERIPKYDEVVNELKNIIAPSLEHSEYSGIEEIPRQDNKLKDYLEHSQKKFPSGNNYFNILVITLEIVKDLDEWYSYILGDNGVFTNHSYVDKCYDNVDAILLSTPVGGQRAWKNNKDVNVWHLEETINLLILDPRKEHTDKGGFFLKKGMDLFGNLTREFFLFQEKLDKEEINKTIGQPFNTRYIRFKEIYLRICSEFIESLKK